MRCPGCQHENPAGSNFCLGCGGRLALACAVCDADLPDGARFCNKCGAPIAAESGGHCHLGLGKLYRRLGKREPAEEHLRTATTMYREMDMRFWLDKAPVEMNPLA